ncbi:MAG: alpha/beta fold hydrolase [Polyangiaceae bacterium]
MFCRRLARSRSMLALGFMMFAVGCSDSDSDSAAGSAAQAGASGSAGTGGSAGTSGQSGTAGEGGAAGSAGSAGSSGAAGAGGTAGAALVFGTCQEGYQTECASFQAPLNHDATGGETIDIHISRIPATSTANRQIWLLSGGPGQGGYVYHDFAAQISGLIPDADVYVIDHRGTGYSHRLTCPQQDTADSYGGYVLQVEDVPACLDALKTNGDYDRLPYFTTKQAAKDLELAISLTRAPEQKVFVWGGSYGTHWAHRFMQVAPTVAEGIIFDGFMTPNHFAFTHYDQGVEEAVSHFSDDCKADPVCVAKMGNDPFSHAKSVMDGLGSTPCGQFARSNARTWGSIFMDGFYSHAFVFPYVHRLERCNAEDKTALVTMVQNYYAALTAGGPQPYLSSGILQYNIVLTELWKLPGEAEPSAQSLDDAADQQVSWSGASLPRGLVSLRTLKFFRLTTIHNCPCPFRRARPCCG